MRALRETVGCLLLGAAVFSLPLVACDGEPAGSSPSMNGDDPVADDNAAASADALSGSTQVGVELETTARVNFRSGPGTQHAVVRALESGTTVTSLEATPTNSFYKVRFGNQQGWVHGAYLKVKSAAPPPPPPPGSTADGGAPPPAVACVERRLRFSADALPALPTGAFVWGGNATGGEQFLNPPYAPDFLARASQSQQRAMPVFAYLEGPCGDTGGVDDGERLRCERIHKAFNAQFAPGTPNTPQARWKPYTMKQLTSSGANNVDYCEIDNLSNNVVIPLNPLLREIKTMFDAKQVHCRIVLKNVEAADIDSIRQNVAPTVAAADFIAPFHIFEDSNTSAKAGLDAAMRRLKGQGAVTIISTDTNHYGSAFTPDKFLSCP